MVRADADSDIGSGHFMRSLALAQAWLDAGGSATFLTRCPSNRLRLRAREAGVDVVELAASYPSPVDLVSTLEILEDESRTGRGMPWLVTDGYFFTPDYHAAVRARGYPVLIIDDTGHLPVYHARLLLNQNLGAETIEYTDDPDTDRLLGTRFALLRPEFLRLSREPVDPADHATRVLVTFGGSDPHDLTRKVVDAIGVLHRPELEVTVVVGASNLHRDSLERQAAAMGGRGDAPRVTLEFDVGDMAAVMSRADLAVSAGGSTCWELACAGVPSVIIPVAENQLGIAAGLEEEGAAINLGWHEGVAAQRITAAVESLLDPRGRRGEMARAARRLVDGRGAERVVEAMHSRTPIRSTERRQET